MFMAVSVFDLFKIGIGPSSSHTVGPMRAAARFISRWLDEKGVLDKVVRVRGELFGSLAHTGRGHGTDKAVLCGFEGEWPDEIEPDAIPAILKRIRADKKIRLLGKHEIAFDEKTDLVFNKRQKLPYHSNGMRFTAFAADGETIVATRDYYSVGGGFVVNHDEAADNKIVADTTPLLYPFKSGDELLALCEQSGKTIAQVMFANEKVWRDEAEIRAVLKTICLAMDI
jgi:L-serine dehydratase